MKLRKYNSVVLILVTFTLLTIIPYSCIKDQDYEERTLGKPGTSKWVFRWQSSFIYDEYTGITDTIYPQYASDSILIEFHDRFQVFVGSELALDLGVIGGGSIDDYRAERPCDQTVGGYFMLLSGDNKVYYKLEEGTGYFRFWQLPFIDGTTYDSPNLFGIDRQCKSSSRFTLEIIHY